MQDCHASPLWCIVGGLLFAWILSLFGVADMFVTAMHEHGQPNATHASYYMFFFSLSLLLGSLGFLRDLIFGCENRLDTLVKRKYLNEDELRKCQEECSDCRVATKSPK